MLGHIQNIQYILITPACNEEEFIGNTLQAVAQQTLLPQQWIIVINGSTDGTEEIVRNFARRHSFIKPVALQVTEKRDFSNKVHAIQYGYNLVRDWSFDFIGILDADITVESSYFEKLLARFQADPRLGIAGGTILEKQDGKFVNRYGNSSDYVAGAVQMFRRECWEQIGGYRPMKYAHEDTVATEMARMRGWQVQPFADLPAYHHRRSSTGGARIWKARLHQGEADYMVGYHPLFELVKFVRRLTEKPFIIGSLLRWLGYLYAFLLRKKRPVSEEFVSFLQKRQLQRVKKLRFN